MLNPHNISIIFYALPIYQLLYFSVNLITFSKSNSSRKYLGLLLVSMTLFLVINAMYQHGNTTFLLGSYYFFIPLLLIQPPLFYLYIYSLAREGEKIKWFSKFVLFIPSMLILIANLFIFGITSTSKLEIFIAENHSIFSISSIEAAKMPLLVLWFSLGFLLTLQLLLAVFKVKTLLDGEKAAIKEQSAHLAILQLKWVYLMSLSLLFFIITCALLILFVWINGLTVSIIFNVLILLSSGLLGYYGMKQDDLVTEVASIAFMPVPMPDNYDGSNTNGKLHNKTKKTIPDAESKEIIKKIIILMEQEKPYVDTHYNIANLCRRIGVKQSKVTYVINEVMGKNFYGFINEYRVREAMQIMITDDRNLTIDTIADLVGFHSRSSFYPCFMKYSGLTPKEFVGKVKRTKMKDIETIRR